MCIRINSKYYVIGSREAGRQSITHFERKYICILKAAAESYQKSNILAECGRLMSKLKEHDNVLQVILVYFRKHERFSIYKVFEVFETVYFFCIYNILHNHILKIFSAQFFLQHPCMFSGRVQHVFFSIRRSISRSAPWQGKIRAIWFCKCSRSYFLSHRKKSNIE